MTAILINPNTRTVTEAKATNINDILAILNILDIGKTYGFRVTDKDTLILPRKLATRKKFSFKGVTFTGIGMLVGTSIKGFYPGKLETSLLDVQGNVKWLEDVAKPTRRFQTLKTIAADNAKRVESTRRANRK